ncbi:hypothetical protein BCR39DRAFT_496867 [Naematelia encephala]|uniref:Phytanoyl-CoA dioxygenase n=1 Tax=Naematelia encephala TaxID=71784 RepID=A0A1Y2AZC0_9TREE|nr:hypothetical protein BCR39DRAFT_496867 [Naematelia encephala]
MVSTEDLNRYVKSYKKDGFVIVPGLIRSTDLEPLRAAAEIVTERARKHEWKQVRVVGKQFPPWTEEDDIWGVQNIMHPELGQDIFREWYGRHDMLQISAALMGCELGDMQFELFNMLINPLRARYGLSWHRDDVKATATAEEEEEALKIDHHGIQWNAALYDDECLSAIPGSHSRIRTSEEREANLSGGSMPGSVPVALKAGETVFYNNNILHVGKYTPETKRRTLHGCYGSPPVGDDTRARNILQHDLSYTRDPAFRELVSDDLKPMLDKLNSWQRRFEGVEIGYSQDL